MIIPLDDYSCVVKFLSGKYLRKILGRTALQSTNNTKKFITIRKIDRFEFLAKHLEMRERLQNLLKQGENITPKQWKAEIQSLQSEYNSISKELAYAEVISYNKKNLERELLNESRRPNRQQSKSKRREEEI